MDRSVEGVSIRGGSRELPVSNLLSDFESRSKARFGTDWI
jgi:hypothetical protein